MKPKSLPPRRTLLRSFLYKPETGLLTNRETGFTYSRPSKEGYLYVLFRGQKYPLHRIIYQMVYGTLTKRKFIDHIDRNRTNNRISNLRLVSAVENGRNRNPWKQSSTNMCGVKWHALAKKYIVRIGHKRKVHHIGLFSSVEDAIKARKEAEKQFWATS